MNKFKFFVVSICLIFAILAKADNRPTRPKWSLSINLEKNTFLVRECIWLDVILTNISSDTLRFWSLYPGLGLNMTLTDSIGDTIPYSGPVFDLVMKEGELLNREEETYDSFELIGLFAVMDIRTINFWALTPGQYLVQASYGDAVSDRIAFRVVSLSEKEKEYENAFIKAIRIRMPESYYSNRSSLNEMFEPHANGPFAENAGQRFLSSSDFLEKFPNSGHTKEALQDQTSGLTDEEKIEYLKNAIIKYKGTRAARHAEQLLRDLSK